MNMKVPSGGASNQELLSAIEVMLDAKLDAKIGTLDAKLDAKIGTLDAKLDAKIGTLDAKIDASHAEVLEVIHEFSQQTDERFIALEREQIRMRAVMVTKDYLDDKLSDLRSSIIRHTQREIEKARG
ncbi:MAG: hypothetical protein AAB668_02285 [Patescibacteria group bacterium]